MSSSETAKILPPAYPFLPPPLPHPSSYQHPFQQPFPFIGPYQQNQQRASGQRSVTFFPLSPEGFGGGGAPSRNGNGSGQTSNDSAITTKRSESEQTKLSSVPNSAVLDLVRVGDSRAETTTKRIATMALGDENAEDEKEEKPKVYKSAIDSEDVASTSRNSHRPTAAGVGEQDDVKQEKNDVCLEANVQPCPSTSGSASGSSSSDGIAKHPSKDASAASGVGGPATVAVNGASPKAGNGKPANATASTVPTTCPGKLVSCLATCIGPMGGSFRTR